MAEACDVHRSTMNEWAANFPEFSEALSRAKQKARVWFERQGRTGLTADKFNSSLWAKQMSARHPEDYTDRFKAEHTGKNGGPIQTAEQALDLSSMPPKNRDVLREILVRHLSTATAAVESRRK